LLDWITDKNVRNLLNLNVKLNFTKVIGIGHSFGGCTVLETAKRDVRLNGGLILYDPWYLPLS